MDTEGGDAAILAQLVSQHGLSKVLMPEYLSYVEHMRQFHISNVPVCLLAKLLSFCNVSDIFSIIQVCHKWYAAFKLHTFWERHLETLVLKTCGVKHLQKAHVLLSLPNGMGIEGESFQSRYQWVVRGYCRVRVNHNPGMRFVRDMEHLNSVFYSMADDHSLYSISIIPAPFPVHFWKGNEHRYFTKSTGLQYACIPWKNGKRQKGICIFIHYKSNQGALWIGQSCPIIDYDYATIKPHGQGKWSFPDGSSLSGDHVAFDGLAHGTGLDENGDEVEYFAGTRVSDATEPEMKRRCI